MLRNDERRGRQRGAATLEFHIVAVLALLPLCLGTLQICLLLVANHYVDFAAFAAAREGAMANGRQGTLEASFSSALLPLLVRTGGGVDRDNVVERVAAARLRNVPDMTLFGRVEVLAPGAAAQADFGVERDGVRAIPNDSLRTRSHAAGARSGVTLQQANVLVISATWCHPMVVPLAGEFLTAVMRRLDPISWHQVCYAARRMPIRSRGIAPMQSDFIVR